MTFDDKSECRRPELFSPKQHQTYYDTYLL